MISGGCSRFVAAHVWYARTSDINDAIEIGVNHCLEPLRTRLLERRNIAEPGVVKRRRRNAQTHQALPARRPEPRFHPPRQEKPRGRARRIYLPSQPVERVEILSFCRDFCESKSWQVPRDDVVICENSALVCGGLAMPDKDEVARGQLIQL
jgi:hypothetical protein